MTKPAPRSAQRLAVCVLLVFLSACNTTPERPPPPPVPRAEPTPPPPAPAAPQADREPRQTTSSPAAADADNTYAPPSANAAEVEFEEIPVDEDGKPLRPATAAAAPGPARQRSVEEAAGGDNGADGNTPLARMNDTIAARQRAADGGTSVPTPPGPTSDPDLVGPRMAVGALTTDEHIAAADAELEAGLQAFDERLQRARAAAAAERARSAAGGAPYGAEDGRGQHSERPPERGAGGAAASGTGLGQTPDLSGAGGGTATPRVVGTAPAGLPDGRDDDIVARQLREAASSERDPVLQAKLWDEYRKYKAGQ
ncbi:MAG: hypothetical protein WD928_03800 [Gammaproteobacteria bacterium]